MVVRWRTDRGGEVLPEDDFGKDGIEVVVKVHVTY